MISSILGTGLTGPVMLWLATISAALVGSMAQSDDPFYDEILDEVLNRRWA